MKYSWRNHGKHVTEAGGAPFCCLFKSDFPNCLSPPGRPAQPLLWAPPRTHPRKRGPGFLAQRAERVSYLSPWTLCSSQNKTPWLPKMLAGAAPGNSGKRGSRSLGPFPSAGSGEKASTETNKMAKAFGPVGEEMAFSVFLQLPGWRKSKQSKRKLLLCSSPQESCRLGPERELPAQRGSCDRAAATVSCGEGRVDTACPRCS